MYINKKNSSIKHHNKFAEVGISLEEDGFNVILKTIHQGDQIVIFNIISTIMIRNINRKCFEGEV